MLLRCLFNQWEGWRIAEARRVFGETEKAPPPPEAGETSAPLKETPLTPEEAAKELKQVEGKLQALKLAITTLEKNLSSVDPQKATPQGTEFQELHNQAQRMHDGFSKALEAVSTDPLLKTEALQANVDQRLDRILQKTASTIPDSTLLKAVTASTVSATITSTLAPGAPLLAPSLKKVTSTPPDSIETKMKALEIRKNETLEKMGGKNFDLFSAYQSLPTFLKQRIDRSDVSRKQNADPLMKLRALESVVNALEEYQRLTDSTQGIRYGATEGAYGPNLFDDHFSKAGTVLHNAFFDTAGGMGGKGSYVELVGARLGINPDPNDLQEKKLNAHFALKVKGLPDSEAVTTASSFSEDSISISLKGKTIEEAVADAMREFVERKDVQKTLKKQFRQHEETLGLKRDAVARQDAHIDKVAARQDRKEERKDDRRLDDPQHPSSHPDYKGESREDLVNRIREDHGNPEDYIIRWEEKGGKNGHWIAKRFQDRTEEGTAQAPAKETEKKGEKPHEDLLKRIIIDQPVGLGPISPKTQELLVKSGVKIQLEKIGQDPQAKQYQTLLVFSEKSPPANYPFPQGTRMNFSTKDEKGPLTLTTTDEKGTQKVYLVTSDGLTLPPAKPSPAPAIQKEGKLSNIETSQAGPINIDSGLDSEIKNEITDTDLNILSKLTSSTPEFTTSADRLYRLVVQEGHSRILWNSKPQEKNIWGDVSNENLHVVETPPGTYVDCTLVPSGSYLKTNEGNRYFSSHNGKEFVFEEKGNLKIAKYPTSDPTRSTYYRLESNGELSPCTKNGQTEQEFKNASKEILGTSYSLNDLAISCQIGDQDYDLLRSIILFAEDGSHFRIREFTQKGHKDYDNISELIPLLDQRKDLAQTWSQLPVRPGEKIPDLGKFSPENFSFIADNINALENVPGLPATQLRSEVGNAYLWTRFTEPALRGEPIDWATDLSKYEALIQSPERDSHIVNTLAYLYLARAQASTSPERKAADKQKAITLLEKAQTETPSPKEKEAHEANKKLLTDLKAEKSIKELLDQRAKTLPAPVN